VVVGVPHHRLITSVCKSKGGGSILSLRSFVDESSSSHGGGTEHTRTGAAGDGVCCILPRLLGVWLRANFFPRRLMSVGVEFYLYFYIISTISSQYHFNGTLFFIVNYFNILRIF
jgi:hypothetical protein